METFSSGMGVIENGCDHTFSSILLATLNKVRKRQRHKTLPREGILASVVCVRTWRICCCSEQYTDECDHMHYCCT